MRWVLQDELARTSRPGYGGEIGRPVPESDVQEWISRAKRMGIKSIICLLSDDQLPLYEQLPDGLVKYYETNGFRVAHVPIRDHQNPAATPEDLERIANAFELLPKPVLIHCSAGVDRTGAAIRHIQQTKYPFHKQQ